MPDPSWTFQYNLNSPPTSQGFDLTQSGTPTINAVTSGAPANRRLEVDTTNGDAIYIQQNEPTTFDPAIGLTGEIELEVDGGNAGFEFTFLDRALLLDVRSDNIALYSPGEGEIQFFTDMTTRRKIRVTLDSSQLARVYVDDDPSEILGPYDCNPSGNKPARRFLFWAERIPGQSVPSGLITFWGKRFYDGGPVIPG